MSDAVVRVENVTKRFAGHTAVKDLSLDVPRGVIFGLLGPNGAGKSTTIRMIMDIIAPDEGRVVLFGGVGKGRDLSARIGFLPEERGLYKKMKVLDHLVFLAEIKGMPGRTARQKAGQWLDRLGLNDWTSHKIEDLSKGMQQKVQFIATIVHDPKILILDEPFSGLDPINTALLKDYFQEFRARGKTIVFSTHVLEQAEKLCDEICLLARSKKILEGSLKDLKKQFSHNLVHLSVDADPGQVAGLPGVVSCQTVNGGYVVALNPDTDRREFLRQTLERYPVSAFSEKEPDLEEIYLEAVRAAGLEETREIA